MFNEMTKKLLNGRIRDISRCLDLVSFSILPEKSDIEIGLHIQCFFRITKDKNIIMSQNDIFSIGKKCKKSKKFKFGNPYETLFDDCREKWIEQLKDSKIIEVLVQNNDLLIYLENGFNIEIYIDSVTEEEKYRLFDDIQLGTHYVVYTNNILEEHREKQATQEDGTQGDEHKGTE